jgi:hypothetical protein
VLVVAFSGYLRLVAMGSPEQDGRRIILRPGRGVQGMGLVVVVGAIIAATLMCLTAPELRSGLPLECLVAAVAALVSIGVSITVRASIARVVVVPHGIVQVRWCGSPRRVCWSHVVSLTYLPTAGALRIEARDGRRVDIGVVLVGFSRLVEQMELHLPSSIAAAALSDWRRRRR